jgi:hypothetical protein
MAFLFEIFQEEFLVVDLQHGIENRQFVQFFVIGEFHAVVGDELENGVSDGDQILIAQDAQHLPFHVDESSVFAVLVLDDEYRFPPSNDGVFSGYGAFVDPGVRALGTAEDEFVFIQNDPFSHLGTANHDQASFQNVLAAFPLEPRHGRLSGCFVHRYLVAHFFSGKCQALALKG